MKAPIIFYHEIFGHGRNKEKYAISLEQFKDQTAFMVKNGFKSISLDALFHPAEQAGAGNVVISFDDGCYSDYSHATPVLSEQGLAATFFVVANWVGKPGFAGWPELREMSGLGMSIQSHSLNHRFLSDLDNEELSKELSLSKDILEQGLGKAVEYISLPGGFCSRRVIRAAEAAGYKAVCTSVPGLITIKPGSFRVFDRLLITRNTGSDEFARIISGNESHVGYKRAQHLLKNSARKLLGSRVYYSIWSKLFKEVK